MSETKLVIEGAQVVWHDNNGKRMAIEITIGDQRTFVAISPAPKSKEEFIDLVTEMVRHFKK